MLSHFGNNLYRQINSGYSYNTITCIQIETDHERDRT